MSGGFFQAARKPQVNDEIESDDEDIVSKRTHAVEEIDETPAEKKLRLAKEYISRLKEINEDDVDKQIIDDKHDSVGRLFKPAASEMDGYFKAGNVQTRLAKNGHRKPPTVVVMSPNNMHVYTGGKDGSVFKWDTSSIVAMRRVASAYGGRKDVDHVGHQCDVLALAINTNGDIVASGDETGKIILWDEHLHHIHQFTEHKKSVTGLVFRRLSGQLFSCSSDKTVKVWDVESRSYIETLFGHQDTVQAIDANTREKAITAGGRDNTIRIFKIPEETQLVYRGHHGSIDCIALLSDEYFISGGDDGAINYWSTKRKKPICVVRNAHGGTWITALGALLNSDVFISGAADGFLRVWRPSADRSRIEQFHSIKADGIINSIRIASDHRTIVAAVGQENRLGRWMVNKKAKNGILVIRLGQNEESSSEEGSSSEEESGSAMSATSE